MTVLSAFVDLAMAGLMVALLVYCVKLNRRLATVRDSDAEIRQMIVELQNAAGRAEASVSALKAAGVEAERLLRVQVVRAEALRDELGAIVRRPPPAPVRPSPAPARAAAPPPPAAAPQDDGVPYPDPPSRQQPDALRRPAARSEAEQELLRAIRIARAEG